MLLERGTGKEGERGRERERERERERDGERTNVREKYGLAAFSYVPLWVI